jgi:hypothetical protein
MEREKIRLEFENYKEATQEVGNLLEKAEENASLKAELECAKKVRLNLVLNNRLTISLKVCFQIKKLLTSYQDKFRKSQLKHEEQLNEINEKMKLEQDASLSTQRQLESKEKQVDELRASIREVLNEKQSLINENLTITEKLKSYEVLCSVDSFKLFKLLFKELSSCTIDLECLARNCIDIYNGKPIDVCSLLGTPNRIKSN